MTGLESFGLGGCKESVGSEDASESHQEDEEEDEAHDDYIMTDAGANLQPAAHLTHQEEEMLQERGRSKGLCPSTVGPSQGRGQKLTRAMKSDMSSTIRKRLCVGTLTERWTALKAQVTKRSGIRFCEEQ